MSNFTVDFYAFVDRTIPQLKEVKRNVKFDVFLWISFLLKDFMRCVTASIIFFIISIIAVSKYVDGSSKAAGVKLLFKPIRT